MFLLSLIALFSFALHAAPEIKWEDQEACLIFFYIKENKKEVLYKQSLISRGIAWDEDFSKQYVNFIPVGNMIQTGQGSDSFIFTGPFGPKCVNLHTSEYKKFTTDTIKINLKDVVIICQKMPIKVIKKYILKKKSDF